MLKFLLLTANLNWCYYYPFSRDEKTGAERSGYWHVVIKQTPFEVLVNRKWIPSYVSKYWLRAPKPLGHSHIQVFLQYTILHIIWKSRNLLQVFWPSPPVLFPTVLSHLAELHESSHLESISLASDTISVFIILWTFAKTDIYFHDCSAGHCEPASALDSSPSEERHLWKLGVPAL